MKIFNRAPKALLCLLAGTTIVMAAQPPQEKKAEPARQEKAAPAQPQQHAQPARPQAQPHQEQPQRAQQPQPQQQQQRAQQPKPQAQPQQQQPKQQAQPQQKAQQQPRQATPPQQKAQPRQQARQQAQPAQQARASGQRAANYAPPQRSTQQAQAWQQKGGWKSGGWQGGASFQAARASNWSGEHRGWAQRGGYGGYYIPQASFGLYFGDNHYFQIGSQPFMVGGYPEFRYGGYTFMMVDPGRPIGRPTGIVRTRCMSASTMDIISTIRTTRARQWPSRW